ncbi:MAG: glycosyltransferase, partial [Actinobacteria bacterium]|nr:glycosyltransferase [Actinomycetota bacterium]
MDLRLVLLDGGPLIDDYRRSVPTRLLHGGVNAPLGRLGAAARSVGLPVRAGEGTHGWVLRPSRADVVVANTLVSLPFSARVAGRGTRLVCHVHELDGVADRVLPEGSRRTALVGRVDRFIAAGAPVAEMLVDRWGLASRKVVVVDEWIDVD